MRVTNLMMNSNMLNNIFKNKEDMSKKFDQYATGQKIQRPSEDPVVAVRSLKYRSQLTQLEQYYSKNVPDARSWMDLTETALSNMDKLLTSMSEYCVQGSTDTLDVTNRNSIAATLEQYKGEIYQSLNTDYAGRYIFAGYRTDTSLLFGENTTNMTYTITEPLTNSNIDRISYVKGGLTYDPTKTAEDYASSPDTPQLLETYRVRLSYGSTDSLEKLTYTDSNGTVKTLYDGTTTPPSVDANFTFSQIDSTDPEAYTAADNEIKYITDTGELILGNDAFELLNGSTYFNVEYQKSTFDEGDLKPEFYFNCSVTTYDNNGQAIDAVEYTAPSEQNIYFEVNFRQNLKVNTMANETLNTTIGRQVDEILSAISDVEAVEEKLANVELMLQDESRTDLDALEKLKEQIETEWVLKNSVMQEKFGNAITTIKNVQTGETYVTESGETKQRGVGIADTSLGSRYVRLDLTEDRLLDQRTALTDLLKSNETVDLEEAMTNYNSALLLYNASLMATGKVVQSTLLDFL